MKLKISMSADAPNSNPHAKPQTLRAVILSLAAIAGMAACERKPSDLVQGYVEGEFVYVASPLPGALETLSVQRGAVVKVGDPLFALECGSEKAALDEAERKLTQGAANLEDARKGKRPSEIESIAAQLRQAHASLALNEKEYHRQETLLKTGASAKEEMDKALSMRDQDQHRVAQLEADLQTSQLGSRTDQIDAAAANVRALEAARAKAQWDFSQKRQNAPQGGLVFDTLYWQGEWVPSGKPVISLLPPERVKVRAFVPEQRVGSLQPGSAVQVYVDGTKDPYIGKVTFISPQPEYVPPVIYSQESRRKLVFMVEASFDPAVAVKLHPGQPVDVRF